MPAKKKKKWGFTLLELLIVIFIIAIITIAIFLALDPLKRFNDARESVRQEDVAAIRQALQVYQVDHGGDLPAGVDTNWRMLGTDVTECDTMCAGQDGLLQSSCLDISTDISDYLAYIPADPAEGSDAKTYYAVRKAPTGGVEVMSCFSIAAALAQSGLVGQWNLNENSGVIANDSRGSHDGDLIGGIWTTAGVDASGLIMAAGQGIDVTNAAGLDITDTLSLEAWVYITDNTLPTQYIMTKGSDADLVYGLSLEEDDILFFVNGVGAGANNILAADEILEDTWYHIVGTYDGTALRLYKNGVFLSSSNYAAAITTNDFYLHLSCRGNADDTARAECLSGKMDELSLWDRSLSAQEISDRYSALAPALPLYSEYPGGTDFALELDITDVDNMSLANAKGSITFPPGYSVNASAEDYDRYVHIGDGFISVNKYALDPSFDAPVTLTLNNVSCPADVYYSSGTFASTTDIINNGALCTPATDPSCTAISCVGNTLTFHADHFSSYGVLSEAANVVVPDGLMAYWQLDENTGTLAQDTIGENDGTISGATWESGVSGSALNFDGSGGHIAVPQSTDLNITTDEMTLSGWFQFDPIGDNGTIIFKNSQYFLRINDQGRVSFVIYNPNWTEIQMDWADRIEDTDWHHVVGVYTGSEMNIYIDGVLLAQRTGVSGNLQSGSSEVRIGAQSDTLNQFDGLLDEIRVYNRGLSAAEVYELYTGRKMLTLSPQSEHISCQDLVFDLTGDGEVQITTTPAYGTWSLVSGAGTLTNSGGLDGTASYLFAAPDRGEATLALNHDRSLPFVASVTESANGNTTSTAEIPLPSQDVQPMKHAFVNPQSAWTPRTSDMYDSYWSDGSRDAFDGFGYPEVCIGATCTAIDMNGSGNEMQNAIGSLTSQQAYTVAGVEINIAVDFAEDNHNAYRIIANPGDNYNGEQVKLRMRGNLGSDGSTRELSRIINIDGTDYQYYVTNDESTVEEGTNGDPQIRYFSAPNVPTWSRSGDNIDYSVTGMLPQALYLFVGDVGRTSFEAWLNEEIPLSAFSIRMESAHDTLTCDPEPFVIQFPYNVPPYCGDITVDLSVNNNEGAWSVISGAGTLINSGQGDGVASYTFSVADAGEATLAVTHPSNSTLQATLNNALYSIQSSSNLVYSRSDLYKHAFVSPQSTWSTSVSDLYDTRWGDASRDSFDNFGYPEVCIGASCVSIDMNGAGNELQNASGAASSQMTYTVAGVEILISVDFVDTNHNAYRIIAKPGNNYNNEAVKLRMRGNLGSDSGTREVMHTIQDGGDTYTYRVTNDSTDVDEGTSGDPQIRYLTYPGTLTWSRSSDNVDYSVTGVLPEALYLFVGDIGQTSFEAWVLDEVDNVFVENQCN